MVLDKPAYRFNGRLPAALDQLKARPQWITWTYVWKDGPEGKPGKWTKPPLSAHVGRPAKGGAQNPDNWGTFDQAVATQRRHQLAGVGYVITRDDNITGIDIDHCINDSGSYNETAAEVLSYAETYAEVSPSGEGIRLFCLGKYAGGVVKKDAIGVEVYIDLRYLTVTGDQIDGTPCEIAPAPRTLAFLAELAQVAAEPETPACAPPRPTGGDFFANVNAEALARLDQWVPQLHPNARKHATGAWRIPSKALGRGLEEDLSYHPTGIRDHGEENGLTPIDAVLRYGAAPGNAIEAAFWLCRRMSVEPAALGWKGAVKPVTLKIAPLRSASDDKRQAQPERPALVVISGDDDAPIPPRQWLLGTTFCRGFVSALVAPGGTGKTALRLLQLMSLATGRQLTGETVHHRTRVLWLVLEDDNDEARRRIRAARLYYDIPAEELNGWFFRLVLTHRDGKVVALDDKGQIVPGELAETVTTIIKTHGIGAASFDPFVKAHGVEENDNKAIDAVMQVLTVIANEQRVAIDTVHHVSKGAMEPGNADKGRGASAMKDAARLSRTLTTMSADEARTYDIQEKDRRSYVRYDDAKVNLAPIGATTWFQLVGVSLGNGTPEYPNGDNVQTVKPWAPPDTFEGISSFIANQVLDRIDAGTPAGERYTADPRGDRAAWAVVKEAIPRKTEMEARLIIKTWVRNGVLEVREYESKALKKKDAKGLFLVSSRRPG